MKHKRFWLIVGVFLAAGAVFIYVSTRTESVVRRALGGYKCDPPSVEVNFGPEYKGKLIDAHIHLPDDQERWLLPLGSTPTISKYACNFKLQGISKVFAFFPIYPGFGDKQIKIAERVSEEYPDMFVPFIMPPDNDESPKGFPTVTAEALEEMLDKAGDVFRGYGEIGLYERGDHGGPKGAPALSPDSERLKEIYPIVRERDLMVYFHLGEGQQQAFERIASQNRDIDFIFHGDQLIRYEDGIQNLRAIDEILYRNPNAYYGVDELYGDTWLLRPEVSKKEFIAHFKDYEELLDKDVATWKGFIERHPDQVLWGTDRGWFGGWPLDIDAGIYLTRYARAFIYLLDPAVQERFAYKNAERLLNKH